MIRINKGISLLLVVLLAFVDQSSKFIIFSNNIGRCLSFFCIKTAINRGIAFGLFSMSGVVLVATLIISLLVIGVSLFYVIKNKALRLALVFIVSGTAGNLIDRLLFRYVRDFIAIGSFPAFNLADIFNITGVALLIIVLLRNDNQNI